jgi:hypothetical protein
LNNRSHPLFARHRGSIGALLLNFANPLASSKGQQEEGKCEQRVVVHSSSDFGGCVFVTFAAFALGRDSGLIFCSSFQTIKGAAGQKAPD